MRQLFTIILLLNLNQAFSQSSFEIAIDSLFSHYEAHAPGVSILVAKEKTILYKKDFGLANLEYDHPISSATIFNAASLSKQFVAFGIYLLEQEGKLSFDDNVKEILPELSEYAHPIIITHLLTHTSGIRDQWGLLSLAGYRMNDFISHEAVLKLIFSQKELNFESGTQFEYSHSNYTLLAQVIESVTGMSLNEYMKENIFDPLKMDKTFFLDSSTKVIEDRAYSYEIIDDSYNKVNLNYQNYGPTNLMTTVDDLSKWTSSLSNNSLAPEALIRAFDSVGELSDGSQIIAADLGEEKILGCKGQFYRNYKGLNFYSHGGSIGGFRGFLGRIPDENISIIILGNVSSLNTYSTALKIVDILFELDDNPEEIGKLKETIAECIEEPLLVNPEQYIGEYFNNELNTNIQLKMIKNQLQLSIGRNGNHDLTYIGTDEFKAISMHEVNLKFLRKENKGIKGIKVSTLGVREMNFEKVEEIITNK